MTASTEPNTDIHQERYQAHQKRKRDTLTALLLERHSERAFDDRPVDPDALHLVRQAMHTAPSSCDRRGLVSHEVTDRDSKAILGGLLVGGVGWVHRAPLVVLLWGDPAAYKAPGEIAFMPYLDAGAVVGQALLAATAAGLAACYVNPSVRPDHRFAFNQLFCPLPYDREFHGNPVYCGAVALGHPHPGLAT